MNSIKLVNFKAYLEPVTIVLGGKNMLLCGENGTGKTSLFEAMRLAYCRKDIIDSKFTNSMPEEERVQLRNDILDEYNNQRDKARRFSLDIDEIAFEQYDITNKEAYFISDGYISYDTINVKQIMSFLHLSPDVIADILDNNLSNIFSKLNDTIHNMFIENITVALSDDGSLNCIITDTNRGLNNKEFELTKYFNESKLRLTIALLALVIARQGFDIATEKERLLVIDDIVTSMDMTNREILIKYLLDTFADVQLVVLTHNISFFNLFSLNIKRFGQKERWIYRHLYDVDGVHKVYEYEENTVKSLRKRLKEGEDPEKVGNDIRKRFESLVVELARLRSVDSQIEPMTCVLDKLIQGQSIYLMKEGDKVADANDMLTEIVALIKNVPTIDGLQHKVDGVVKKYKVSYEEFKPFIQTLQEITIYQKLVMHQLSHGVHPKATFSIKEQQLSFKLLEKLEEYVDKGHSSNTDGEVAAM